MKKLALVLAIVLVASFSVQASDLKIKGSYRLVGNYLDKGYDDTLNAQEAKYFDQRFRVQFDWKVNDNVATRLRTDLTEATWDYGTRPSDNSDVAAGGAGTDIGEDVIMIDRAYAKIKSGNMTMVVGLQNDKIGMSSMWADQFTGITANFKLTPVNVKLIYTKDSEGTTTADDDGTTYGISATYKSDAFTGILSYMTERVDSITSGTLDSDLNGISGTIMTKIAGMKFSAEMTHFSGDTSTAGVEFAGTQLYATLDAKLTDTISGKLSVLWADDQNGTTEIQATNIKEDIYFRPLDFEGALRMDNGLFSRADNLEGNEVFDIADLGSSIGAGATEENAGVMGIIGDIKIAATDAITLYGKLGYLEPNASGTNLNSIFVAAANADYKWLPKVTVSAGVSYASPDYTTTTSQNDNEEVVGMFRLGVSF